MGALQEAKRLSAGMASFVLPSEVFDRRRERDASGTSIEEDARYGYSVWLRHLVIGAEHGLDTHPAHVLELGPGDSSGVGIAALMSGAQTYRALDVLPYDVQERSVGMLQVVEQLFRQRAPIPDGPEFVDVHPRPEELRFPSHILNDERVAAGLRPERLARIRQALWQVGTPSMRDAIVAFVPAWDDPGVIPAGSIDLIVSQAVMEHVTDLAGTYAAMADWLAPGGGLSNSVDFRSHELYPEWNGHLAVPAWRWRAMWGRREPLLNRQPASTHLRLLRDHGLEVVSVDRVEAEPDLARSELARAFRTLSPADFQTAVATFQARKPVT